MKDETYLFISDVKNKGHTARSARSKRTHCGKGGRVRLPSDNLSKKELEQMNGECKSYRLNEPMAWKEFKAMPDDIKVTYIKLIRQKFNPPVTQISKMMGVTEACVRTELKRLNLTDGKKRSGKLLWDKEGFWAWVNGNQIPEPVTEETIPEQPVQEEPEVYMEEDIPFDVVPVEEPDPIHPKMPELHFALCAEIDELRKRVDLLTKTNEELMAQHENDSQAIAHMRNLSEEIEKKAALLEAQMDVVRMIFGGKNNG